MGTASTEGKSKFINVRRRPSHVDSTVTVEMIEDPKGSGSFMVLLPPASIPIGRISLYEGTLDRHSGMVRRVGKKRTLWKASNGSHSSKDMTRADAIRFLMWMAES